MHQMVRKTGVCYKKEIRINLHAKSPDWYDQFQHNSKEKYAVMKIFLTIEYYTI